MIETRFAASEFWDISILIAREILEKRYKDRKSQSNWHIFIS